MGNLDTIISKHLVSVFNRSAGISPVVFHYTSRGSALQILETDRFRLSASVGTGSDDTFRPGKKFYYFSTARSPSAEYSRMLGPMGTIFELDGRKLGFNYQGSPVDYWGPDFRKVAPEKSEQEDRIWHTEPYIENASRYIRAIYTKWVDGPHRDTRDAKRLRRLVLEAKKKGIPIYIFGSDADMHSRNVGKALSLDQIQGLTDTVPEEPGYQRMFGKNLKEWLELYYTTSKDQLSKRSLRTLYDTVFSSFPREAESILSNDIHNNKSNPDSGLRSLLNIWRKEGISTAREYLDLLRVKWDSV